jgi:hypothetical protein
MKTIKDLTDTELKAAKLEHIESIENSRNIIKIIDDERLERAKAQQTNENPDSKTEDGSTSNTTESIEE